jgi:hypothetical protein
MFECVNDPISYLTKQNSSLEYIQCRNKPFSDTQRKKYVTAALAIRRVSCTLAVYISA